MKIRSQILVIVLAVFITNIDSVVAKRAKQNDPQVRSNNKRKNYLDDIPKDSQKKKPEIKSVLENPFSRGMQESTATVKSWEEISSLSRNAVMQLLCYGTKPNLFEPFKTADETGGAGTMFVISPEGYALTNFHVVDGNVALRAQIPALGKQKFEVEYIGGNPIQDIALVKLTEDSIKKIKEQLELSQLPFLDLGNSDSLVEALPVMALGYPLGDESLKVSLGFVAGRERTPVGEAIQTTAAINPGNSGGPFVNDRGEVIGVCFGKIVSKGVESVGYFIPINNVKVLLKALRENKLIHRPCWGMSVIQTQDSTLEYLGNPTDGGVYITKVDKGLLADKHGIKAGDVLYAVAAEGDAGRKIDRFGCLLAPWSNSKVGFTEYLSRVEFGVQIVITIYRKGECIKVPVILKQNSDVFSIKHCYPWIEGPIEYEVIFGIVFVQLCDDHIDRLKDVPSSLFDTSFITKYGKIENAYEPRIFISTVLQTSKISEANCFNTGDIIVKQVNGIEVKTIDDLRKAVLAGKGSEYVTIETEGGSFAALKLKDVLPQEQVLSMRYGFMVSPLVEQLKAN